MPAGLDNLKHIVVLMMSGRSFDHMLGGLKKKYPKINGLNGNESNPDAHGNGVSVSPTADYRGQLSHDPDHHFPGVDVQIYGGAPFAPNRVANMQGFIKSYATQGTSLKDSHAVMNYFAPEKIPVLTTLATEYAVFNGWFSSIPGPNICNRAFAHYGTSFGNVDMNMFLAADADRKRIPTIYERMRAEGRSAKIFYYDEHSSSMEVVNLIKDQSFFGVFSDFVADCRNGNLPEFSFVEPNFSDHPGKHGGVLLATDQHADHHVLAGDKFIASVYNAIRTNPELWRSTVLIVTYDCHGGLYDHVVPPNCTPDGFHATEAATGVPGLTFNFDRLGIRVPAVLVSPYIPRGTVVPGPEDPANQRIFEHASIPATITKTFLEGKNTGTIREQKAETFLDLLSDRLRPDNDCVFFRTGESLEVETGEQTVRQDSSVKIPTTPKLKKKKPKRISPVDPRPESLPVADIPGPTPRLARDRWTVDDALGHTAYAYAIYRFLTAADTRPPLAISIQAPWGGGKSSLMRMIQKQLEPDAYKDADDLQVSTPGESGNATVGHVLNELKKASTSPQSSRGSTSPKSQESCEVLPYTGAIPLIENDGRRCRTVWFNAWKYQSTAQVWAGLADCVVQQLGERLNPVERELFWFRLQLRRFDAAKIRQKIFQEIFSTFASKILRWSLLYVAGFFAIGITVIKHFWVGASSLLGTELIAAWLQFWHAKSEAESRPARVSLGEIVRAPDYSANLGFIHEVVEDLKHVFALIPAKNLPVVIFIDDLDRCSPGNVAAVVEAINLFLAGEFPNCMFVLGIDDEMVAAALDKAHSDVIAKLPAYAKSTSIGWRFMDKFVQLPFAIPPASPKGLSDYVDSLLSQDAQLGQELLDRAARVVEKHTATSISPEEVVQKVAEQHPLAPEQQEALKENVRIIQEMNENIKRFTDREKAIRDLISKHAKEYFDNPRDLKRFVNLFRFYYFLRAARQASGESVTSVEQLSRWLVLSLKWPEVVRWLRRQTSSGEGRSSSLAIFEDLAGDAKSASKWREHVGVKFGLKPEELAWLSDGELYKFFLKEASDFKAIDRLSSCIEKAIW